MGKREEHIVLKSENLAIGYQKKTGDSVVCSDINLSLKQNALIGLVGANGAGKSTLLRTLSNIQPKLGGSILLKDRNVDEFNPIQLAKLMSVVLTEPPATRALSVREIVALGRQPYTNWVGKLTADDRLHIENAIEITNTAHLLNRKAFELSDGQLQKVMIARALAQDTDLIILDEPTTHLDMHHKAHILSLLKSLTERSGKTVLFSTHDIDLSIELCDSLIVMMEGKAFYNTPENHISSGIFQSLFPSDLIEFDSGGRVYRVKKKP